jgi:predicted transcriptional regulator
VASFTDRELDLMHALWAAGSATAAEVRDALARAGIDLAYTSVLTMLKVLEEKGHIAHVVDGRAHRFVPLVQRDEATRHAVRRVIDDLFDRSPELLLTHLVRAESLDRQALERLRAIVDEELGTTTPPKGRARPPRRG